MISLIETQRNRIVLKDVRVLDIRGGSLNEPCDVLIENGVITDTDARSVMSGCDVIEGGGLTLAPGLIDCHVHILSPFIAEQSGAVGLWTLRQIHRNFEAMLASGIVCVRDMLSPIKFMNFCRYAVSSEITPGPRILAAGPILSCPGGYPEFVEPLPAIAAAFIGQPKVCLRTPQEAAAVIRELYGQGINVAKVGHTVLNTQMDMNKRLPTITKDILDVICETAHSLGIKVAVHHNCTEDLHEILRCNVDSIEHLPVDREMNDAEVELVKRSGVVVVPTMTMGESAVRFEEKAEFLNSGRASDMFEPNVLQYLKRLAATWLDFSDPEYLKSFGAARGKRENFRFSLRSAGRLQKAGVNFCAGTDMGAVTSFAGETADEAARLHGIGLSRLEAIRSATLNAAKLLGIENKLGAVEPGMDADVMLIEGNPLEDLEALKRVRIVGKGGRWYRTKYPEAPDFWKGYGLFMK